MIAVAAGAAALCAGCGEAATGPSLATTPVVKRIRRVDAPTYHSHPQAVQPVAGSGATWSGGSSSGPPVGPAGVSVGRAGAVSSTGSLPQPESEAAVRRQLAESGMTASPTQATITPDGLAVAPLGAPAAVQEVIAAGNQIARLPYRWGGGHRTYEDTAYDCSGSISFVLAAAHLLDHTVVSGELESFGRPGRGTWITVFASVGHTFMYVAGLRFDTVALAETGSRWSDSRADESDPSSFTARHPAGL